MYDNELTLIGCDEITHDNIGNEIKTPKENKVLCKISSIGATEYYKARTNDLKLEMKFIVHSFEYLGEEDVKFNGVQYHVQRTFGGDTVDRSDNAVKGDEIELTCEKVIGNGS